LSYVTWQEGKKGPEMVVEFLSSGTEREDLGLSPPEELAQALTPG
jgi:Uma2 family endonuclease